MTTSTTRYGPQLDRIYFDPNNPASFASRRKLFVEAKKSIPTIRYADVERWWRARVVPTRFAEPRKKFDRARFITPYADHTWSADLADLSRLARYNAGYRWLLIVQDLFSRKIKALIAQRTKTAKETAASLDALFSGVEKPPKVFFTDQGGEFRGKEAKAVYRKHAVHFYTSNDVTQKSAITERTILAVKRRLYKAMAAEGAWKWIDKLQPIINAFNATYHRALRMTPNEAARPEAKGRVFYNTVTRFENEKLPFAFAFAYSIGQTVRILMDQQFAKSYTGPYSDTLYVITDRRFKSAVPVYYLRELLSGEPVRGIFYEAELEPFDVGTLKLPKIERIHRTRFTPENEEEVLVNFEGEKRRQWIAYKNLLPYKR